MGTMARKVAPAFIPAAQLMAYRQKRQRLDQRTMEPLAQLVGAVGWVPTTGGANPYLALRARAPRWDRHLVDQAVFATHELVELPTPTGFALVPTDEAWMALWAARQKHQRESASWRKGADGKKVGRLRQDLLAALRGGPASQEELRANESDALCSALGAAAKEAGLPTHFHLALRELLLDGLVVRRQRAGRLDRTSVTYSLPKLPLTGEVPAERAMTGLARRYVESFGVVSAVAFARWAGLTETEARAALDAQGLSRLSWEGEDALFANASDAAELSAFSVPVPPRLAFVSHADPLWASVADPCELVPESHRGERVTGACGSDAQGPTRHALVIGGRVAGVWSYDLDEARVEYATFVPLPTRMRRAADDAADQLASFIEDQLDEAGYGHEREEQDRPSIEALQAKWRALAPTR